ncbi:hypothetical protein H0H87_008486, partial [Tephrocybe sp. NHM501043]
MLRKWTQKNSKSGTIASQRDVEKYFQCFTCLAEPLSDPNNCLMLENDVNLCFYRGIPAAVCQHIWHQIDQAHTKSNNAPPRTAVLEYLKDLFDDTDIDQDDVWEPSDINSTDLEEDNLDLKEQAPPPLLKKKKVTFMETERPSEKLVPASPPMPIDNCIDQISKQLGKLVLSYAEMNRSKGLPPRNNFPNHIVNAH